MAKKNFEAVVLFLSILVDFVIAVILMILTALFLIAPSIVVFSFGRSGFWLMLTFMFIPCLAGVYKCCQSMLAEWRAIWE